jgi:hypothetical protein
LQKVGLLDRKTNRIRRRVRSFSFFVLEFRFDEESGAAQPFAKGAKGWGTLAIEKAA